MTAKVKLARCFVVYMDMKTRTFFTFLLNQCGKIPSAIKRKCRKGKNRVHDNETLSSKGDSQVENSSHSTNDEVLHSNDGSVSTSSRINGTKSGDDSESLSIKSSSSNSSYPDNINNNMLVDNHQTVNDVGEEYNSDDDDSNYNPHEDVDNKDPITFTEDVYLDWMELFENMLLLYGWLTKDMMPCRDFKFGS